jgi:glycosyltransferase involved in cell wall biosynthesis
MKIGFADFWYDFDQNRNFFRYLFSQFTDVEVVHPNDADVIIFTCYGKIPYNVNQIFTNTEYSGKKKIFFTGENIRPDYNNVDYAFTFDFDDNPKNIRIPLWLLQIDWFDQVGYGNPKYVIPYSEIYDNKFIKKEKSKFCSFVFNNISPYREEIVQKLSRYKKVDCYGNIHNNWFNGEDMKLDIISNYKFNICFENSIYPGYYTEKPIHAKAAGCVPIYWSDKNMAVDFNEKAFINLTDFNNNVDDLVEYIIEVDNNNELYNKIKSEKIFNDNQDPKILFNSILEKVKNII